MREMDDEDAKLRKLLGEFQQLTYEAVKTGAVDALPRDDQLLARAMQEHMHLKHVHNALEFADLREGAPYEIEFEGNTVNPLAHLAVHAAVKGQIEQDPEVRAAFEKMVATGISAHHAEHVLGALLTELLWGSLGRNRIKSQNTFRSLDSETLSGFAIPQKDDATLPGESLRV